MVLSRFSMLASQPVPVRHMHDGAVWWTLKTPDRAGKMWKRDRWSQRETERDSDSE